MACPASTLAWSACERVLLRAAAAPAAPKGR